MVGWFEKGGEMWDHVSMEHDPLKSKIEVPEIRQEIQEGERIAQEIQEYIDSHLEDLKFHIEQLEFATGYLDHMKSNNEFREEYKAEMGTESRLREYSQQEIQDIENNIKETKALIADIHEKMHEATLLKIDYSASNEVFEKLEKLFNELITRIPPEQEN